MGDPYICFSALDLYIPRNAAHRRMLCSHYEVSGTCGHRTMNAALDVIGVQEMRLLDIICGLHPVKGAAPSPRIASLGLPSYQSLHLHQNNRSSDRTMWIHHRPKTPSPETSDSWWSQICASMGVTLLKDKKTLLRGELHHEISSHGRSVLALSL